MNGFRRNEFREWFCHASMCLYPRTAEPQNHSTFVNELAYINTSLSLLDLLSKNH